MTPTRTTLTPAVAVVGAGPAGLSAAAALGRTYGEHILVLDRERRSGGIPRHSDHTGYGLRDLRRVMTGPAYAKELTRRAVRSGVSLRTESMVTGCRVGDAGASLVLDVTTPDGLLRVEPAAVVLATGARERPRTARLIPGDRPGGVLTTGMLQNLVHLHHQHVGQRAVVVGSELVSWSAVVTLREAGCRTVSMVTSASHGESYLAFSAFGRVGLGVTVTTRTRVVRIIGQGRVSGIEVEDLQDGSRRGIDCDTVVFTGEWIPDHELARTAGLDMDPGTLGPAVDPQLCTSVAGVFAAGNLVHPVDTADVAALDGVHVAEQVHRYLTDGAHTEHTEHTARTAHTGPEAGLVEGFATSGSPVRGRLRLVADDPFRWISPNVLTSGAGAPPKGKLLLWSNELVRFPIVESRQDGRVLGRRLVPWPAAPGRVFRVPYPLVSGYDPSGGDVHVRLARR